MYVCESLHETVLSLFTSHTPYRVLLYTYLYRKKLLKKGFEDGKKKGQEMKLIAYWLVHLWKNAPYI